MLMISIFMAALLVATPTYPNTAHGKTLCQEIAPELREAVKLNQLSEREALTILLRCMLWQSDSGKQSTSV